MRIDTTKTRFDLGELVYMRANTELAGIVNGILARSGSIQYVVGWGDHEEAIHYDFELLSKEQRDESAFKTSE